MTERWGGKNLKKRRKSNTFYHIIENNAITLITNPDTS